jgi:hypothetical protein
MGQRGGCGHKRRPPCLTIEIVKEKFTDFNSPTMYLFFILSLAANLVSSQDPLCAKGNPFLELPFYRRTNIYERSKHTCLDNKSHDGTCASNIKGFCYLTGGIFGFFTRWGNCLKRLCEEDDRYGTHCRHQIITTSAN